MEEWSSLEAKYITRIADGCYALQLLKPGHNEELRTEILTERENVILYHVLGYNKKKNHKRPLGYCFLYLGNPIVHDHTWYCSVCYSDPTYIGYKDWSIIHADSSIRFIRVGLGDFDYLLTYRGKTEDHDRRGLSDGAVRLETAKNWKDGL